MAISTNGTIITRLAGALYNEYLSNASYTELNTTPAATVAGNMLSSDFAGKTDAQIATTVLTNLGLSSVAGLNNWVAAQLTGAGSTAAAKGAKLVSMLNDFAMMTADATYGSYATAFNANTAASLATSQKAGSASGSFATSGAAAAAATAAAKVIADAAAAKVIADADAAAAKVITDAAAAKVIAEAAAAKIISDAAAAALAPQKFALTTGVDTGADFTGKDGSDTYTAVTGTTSLQTLTAGDNLNGGLGADTLNITNTAAATLGAGVITTAIETVNVTATAATTIDASGFTGVTAVSNTGSTADVSITNLKAIPSVSVTGTNSNTIITTIPAATAGAADSATVTLNGVATTSGSNPSLQIDGVETLNVATTGSATGATLSTLTITDNVLSTLNVTGTTAAKLNVSLTANATTAGVITSDAGAHDITFSVPAGAASNVAMNDGNDTVRISSISALQSIDGGLGTDTLVAGTTAITLLTGANIKGFEAVSVGAASVALPVAANPIAAVTFTGTGGSVATVAAGATITQAATGTNIVTNTAGWTGTADSLTVNVGSTTSTGAITQSLSAALIDSATINNTQLSSDTTGRSVGVLGSSLKSLTVNSAGTAAIAITGGGILLSSIDASGVGGVVTVSAGTAAAGFSLKTGAGADTLTGDVGADTLSGGAGNDTITGSAGMDLMTGGDGADTFVFTANVANSVISSQAAPDTIVDFKTGIDKISGTGATSYLAGPFSSFTQGNAAALAAGGSNVAFFSTGDATLYVQATAGTQLATDMAIVLSGVTTFAQGDLLLGAQGTGNLITLTASTGAIVNTTSSNAVSSTLTTALDDTITAGSATATPAVAGLVGATAAIDGGAGNDILNATLATDATLTSITTSNTTAGIALTNVEIVNFTVAASAAALTLGTLPATLKTITVTGTDNNGTLSATTSAAGQTVSVANTLGTTASVITVGDFGGQTITTGTAGDTVNISTAGSNINTGIGNDTIQVTNINALNGIRTGATNQITTINGSTGTADVLAITTGQNGIVNLSATNTNLVLSGIETLTLGTSTATATVLAVTLPASGLTTITGTTGNAGGITVAGTAAAIAGLTTTTFGAGAGAVAFTASDTGAVVTTLQGSAAANWTVTYAAATSATVTEARNFAITGTAQADILNITADLAGVVASTGFETVNFITVAQTGTTVSASTVTTTTNIGGVITLGAASTTFNDTGSAAASVTDAGIASTLTNSGSGVMTVTLVADTTTADTIANTGTGSVVVNQPATAAVGVTTVNLNANSVSDVINNSAVLAVNRVVVTGFTGTDVLGLVAAGTTPAGVAGTAPIVQAVAAAGNVTFLATADVVSLGFELAGATTVLAGDLTGANLLAAIGTVTVANNQAGFIIAYDGGVAYEYRYLAGAAETALTAANTILVGVLNGVAVGGIASANLSLI